MANLTLSDLTSRTTTMAKTPKKKWVQAANLDEGAFTAKAKAAGKSVQEYADEKSDAPGKLGKQARLAQTFSSMSKKSPMHDNPRSK